MEALAIAIFLSTVLHLVDKNRKWSTFWKVTRRCAAAMVLLAGTGGLAFYLYQRHEAAARASAPDFIPAAQYSDLPPGAKVVSTPKR